MKVKKNSEAIGTSDFWYDLFSGGYFKPENYLEHKQDIDDVKAAIEHIKAYKKALVKAKKIEAM
jgi:hypothetical protein